MAAKRPLIQRLCIIGVGLIGRLAGPPCVRRARSAGDRLRARRRLLQAAVRLGVVDRYETDPAHAVAGADVVVVAVPLGAMAAVLRSIVPHLAPEAVVTDVGSAKGSVVEDVARIYGGIPPASFPATPSPAPKTVVSRPPSPLCSSAGGVILTPLAETAATAHHLIQQMWELTGAEVVDMGVHHHDAVLAATSHLPHLLAYTLVDTLARLDDRAEIFRYAAGGFPRLHPDCLHSSDPTMWRDICVANREQLLEMIALFNADLA